ncbi:MAG: hypothetical protein ABI237_00420 [Ginsengibacter sp.]
MKFLLVVSLCLLNSMSGAAQINNRNDLFLSDSLSVYIGIVNTFQLNPGEIITQIGTVKGVNIKKNKDKIEIRVHYPGSFQVQFQTPSGIKNILLISKRLNISDIKGKANLTRT